MESIRIDSTKKQVVINDDPERMIEFDPFDVAFRERFFRLHLDIIIKYKEYSKKFDRIEKYLFELDQDDSDQDILSLNLSEMEICSIALNGIDKLFGDGTSKKVFGDEINVNLIQQFFDGISRYFNDASSEKMTKYINKKMAGRVMK